MATINGAGLASSVSPGSTTITATVVTATPFGPATGVTPGTPIPIRPPTSPISGSTTLTVAEPLRITTGMAPNGVVGQSYNNGGFTLRAAGGSGSYTFTTTAGNLPALGLSLSSGGLISGTPNATGTFGFTAQVTDTSSPPQVASRQFSITIYATALPPLTINTPGLPGATVGIPYTFWMNATGGTGVYTWNFILGSGQTFPNCLSFWPAAGLLNGTPVNTCVGSFSFTMKVTDSASNIATQPLSININPVPFIFCESGNESVLQGQYAFSLIGYRSQGFAARVGSFTADGAGHITGGELDRNNTGGSSANFTLTASTYTVGADNRGCATFAASGGPTLQTRFVLGAISSGTATQGRIIEFDAPNSNAFIATGQLFQQTTATTPSASNFSTGLNGGYVHLLTGWDTTGIGGRIACDGVKTASGNGTSGGTFSNGEQYCNDEGNAPSGPTTGLTGSYTSVDLYGRYTETFGTTNLVGYMVSTAGTGALEVTTSVSGSNTTILAGQAFQQSGGPYDQSSLSGNGVYYATGVNNSTSGKILLALTNSDGVSTFYLNKYYENDGGNWIANGTSGSCTYTVAANGRVSGCGGTMYLSAANTAVIVGNDTGGFAGYVIPQTVPGGGFTGVSGTFFGATTEIVNQGAKANDEVLTLSSSGGNISGIAIGDETWTAGQQADGLDTISGITIGSNGIITPNGSSEAVAVAIDQQHFLAPDHTGCSGSPTCYPTIEMYGPSTADAVAVTINGVSSSSANVTAGTTYGLTLAVTGTSNTGVIWTLNGIPSSSAYAAIYGSISGSYPSFTYTAPTRVPSPATFTITATSRADVSQSASVSVTISAGAGVPPLSITTTSLPSGTVGSQYIQNILTSGGKPPISWIWTGSLPPGLMYQSAPNGVLMIMGMPTATGTYTFTLTASDASSPKQYANQQLSIVINNPPVRITTTSLPNGLTGTLYNQTVVATGGTTPYTWSITGGALPGWASLNSSSGAITGTPSATGTSNFTITVTDSTLPTHQTANQPLSLTINSGAAAPCTDSGSESLLSGQYAFSLSGYSSTGYLAVVGSFTADGSGHITAGEGDSNGALGVQSGISIDTTQSSYSVGSNHLGCATIVTSFGTFNTRLSLGSFVSGAATAGRMVEWDAPSSSTYYAATGQIAQQTASSFSGGLSGNYAFSESGVDGNNSRMAIVGVLSAGSGSFSNGEFDMNDAGSTSNDSGVSGTYASADANGRITGNTTWTGQSSPNHFVLYMVSSSNSLVMTTDSLATNGVLAGQMVEQSGTFTNSSLNGNGVVYLSGLNGGGTGGSASFALINANGTGSLSGTSYYDGGGTWNSPQSFAFTYSVASNGRVPPGTAGAPVFYLTAANQGFALTEDTDVAIGQFEPQVVPGGGFAAASLSGTFYSGDLEVVSYGVASAGQIGVGVVTMSSGAYSATTDTTATTGQRADHTDSGTLVVNSDGTFSDTALPGVILGTLISSTKSVMVNTETQTYPTLQLFKQ